MGSSIDNWNAFLASLATRGGAILILLLLTVLVDVGAFIIYLRHDLSVGQLGAILASGGVFNALLIVLKGSSDSSASVSGPSGSAAASTSAATPVSPQTSAEGSAASVVSK